MRILWHSPAPWHKTGYGILTGLFAPRLRDLGHDVALAVMGFPGDDAPTCWGHPDAPPDRLWDGMRCTGPGLTQFGLPARNTIRSVFGGCDPDLVIVLKDAWVLDPAAYSRYRTLLWLFTDCEPMSMPDRLFFAQAPGAVPVCASLHGLAQARAAGLQGALYVPPAIDMDEWTPGPREAARGLLGLPQDVFIAGIDATNIGPRKGWAEQFTAFAEFHGKHPASLLLVHTVPDHPEGMDLRALARHCGIEDALMFGSHTSMTTAQMVNWYRSLDVLMQGSYGEGFGLPIIQAHAVGVPVIGTRCSAVTEKIPAGTGYLVGGQPWWNPVHEADWFIPSIRELANALGKIERRGPWRPDAIREHALQYDAGHVTRTFWKPILDEVSDGRA
jgi:glycosyltransferase involved in cell wall biosynthesis